MQKPTNLPEIEKRQAVASLRADSQGDEMCLVGRAASFNVLSQDLGGFREVIAPGAFKRTLASANCDVKCLLNHDASLILGRTKSGTLKVWEDERGLNFRCQLDPNNQSHKDFYRSIARKDIDECSFAFQVPDGGDDWAEDTDSNGQRFVKRTLNNVSLMDVSAVTYPAYNSVGATAVSARQRDEDQRRKNRLAVITEQMRAERIAAVNKSVADDEVRKLTAPEASGMNDWMAARLQDALLKMPGGGYHLLDHDDSECCAVALARLDDGDATDSAATWDKCCSFMYQTDPSGNIVLHSAGRYVYQLDDQNRPIMTSKAKDAMRKAFAEAEMRRLMRAAANIFRR